MNSDLLNNLIAKGLLASLPEPERTQAETCIGELKEVIHRHGEVGTFALAILGAELAASE